MHVFKTFFPNTHGGIERVIWDICEGLPVYGYRGQVLTLSPDPKPGLQLSDRFDLTQVRRTLMIASTDLAWAAIPAFARAARESDVIHLHFPWPLMDVAHLLARPSAPCIITYHSDIVRQARASWAYAPLMRHMLGAAVRIVATSPTYLETSPVLARYRDKVVVIPIGATPPRATDATRRAVASRFRSPYILFVGVFRYYKGLDVLVRAAESVDCDIVLAGDGPERAAISRLIAETGVKNVHLAGYVPDDMKAALIENALALVLPSHKRSEAFGVALVEGAAMGKPLVSCQIGTGTSYVNKDGETGFVVAPGDPAALAQAIGRLVADPGLRDRLGTAAKARFERLFTPSAMARAYADLYDVVRAEASERVATLFGERPL